MIRKINLAITAIVLLAIASSCSSTLSAPPITVESNNNYEQGKFVWHDLVTTKVEASKTFYSNLFGWEFDTYKMTGDFEYTMIYKWGRPIGGMIDVTKFKKASSITQWISSISVSDINKSIEVSKKLGAKIYGEPLKLEGRGSLVLAADNQGAAFAMLQSSTGTPAPKVPQEGDWLWNEYWSNDVQKPAKFYSSLFGYDIVDQRIGETDYKLLQGLGVNYTSITKLPNDKINNAWFSYVYVKDMNNVISKVEKFGGIVLMEPHTNYSGSVVALVTDPGGAALLLRTITTKEMEMIKNEVNK